MKRTAAITKILEDVSLKITGRPVEEKSAEERRLNWPISCTVGPGLEGAIACETTVGYVNGSQGRLSYRGYDICDLCAYSTFEEVSYLLLNGKLPNKTQLETFNAKLIHDRYIPATLRLLMSFPVEDMHPMASLRFGTNLLRQRLTWRDSESGRPDPVTAIAADEDSIAMETKPRGERKAIYEFRTRQRRRQAHARKPADDDTRMDDCLHLIAAMPILCAAIDRIRQGKLPIESDPKLGHAANFLYMLTGKIPTPEAARIMDICLILHADHGMNASTFASMVVASTLSDIYFSIGSGISALSGPLHGGANEEVVNCLEQIGSPENVPAWFESKLRMKEKIMGFGHRIYKTHDPRALILSPLAGLLAKQKPEHRKLFATARALEKAMAKSKLAQEKKLYPNIDFYSGIVYAALDIPSDLFTPVFAVSRVAGWTARVMEYLSNNRIFRPRAMYVGDLDTPYVPLAKRDNK